MSSGLRAFNFYHRNKTERRRAASALLVQGGANHPLIFANQRTPMHFANSGFGGYSTMEPTQLGLECHSTMEPSQTTFGVSALYGVLIDV